VRHEEQTWILTSERNENPDLAELYAQAGQDALRGLDKAFKAFFKGIAKHPKFKLILALGRSHIHKPTMGE
jgi:transposase